MIKGKKGKLDITIKSEATRTVGTVDAVIFGPLAVYPMPEKLKNKGKLVKAYVITHVLTGLKVATICGRCRAMEVVQELLKTAAEWEFFTAEEFMKDKVSVKLVTTVIAKYWRAQTRHEKRVLNKNAD